MSEHRMVSRGPADGAAASATALSAKGRRRRAQILDVARWGLLREGYDNLAMRQVAKTCGIALKNLQYYFPTKEDLFAGIVRLSLDEAVAAMASVAAKVGDPVKRVTNIEHMLFELWSVRDIVVWSQLYAMAPNSPRFMTLKEDVYERFYTTLADILAQSYPHAPSDEIYRTTRILSALIDGAAFARTPSRRKALSFATLEKDVKAVTRMILQDRLTPG